jgi:hypothetical protein
VSTIKEWQELFHCWSWLHRIATAVDEMWQAGWKRLYACLQMLLKKTLLFVFLMHFVPATPVSTDSRAKSTQIKDHKYTVRQFNSRNGHSPGLFLRTDSRNLVSTSK